MQRAARANQGAGKRSMSSPSGRRRGGRALQSVIVAFLRSAMRIRGRRGKRGLFFLRCRLDALMTELWAPVVIARAVLWM